jgi:hypothetical protein
LNVGFTAEKAGFTEAPCAFFNEATPFNDATLFGDAEKSETAVFQKPDDIEIRFQKMLGESAYQNHSEHGLIIHNHT